MDVQPVGHKISEPAKAKENRQDVDFSKTLKAQEAQVQGQESAVGKSPETVAYAREAASAQSREGGLVLVGTVDSETPNVSTLLIKHPEFKEDCWNIIYSETNRDKPYKKIQPGTEIYLDPRTKEIVWGSPGRPPERAIAVASDEPRAAGKTGQAPTEVPFCDRLVKAVRPYLGTAYGDMDCYELVVKGLSNLGVQYQGAGGLGRKLMQMAKEKGLPMNAYFNGEGLVAASGSQVYAKTVYKVDTPEKQADRLVKELEPHLEEGLILSFSTPSRGHTGIVSQADRAWTFINSGELDNPIQSTDLPKGVGEEALVAEIRNWFELARERNETLQISLGKLQPEKLLAYQGDAETQRDKA